MTRSGLSLTAAAVAHILAWGATIFFLFEPAYGDSGGETVIFIEVNGFR